MKEFGVHKFDYISILCVNILTRLVASCSGLYLRLSLTPLSVPRAGIVLLMWRWQLGHGMADALMNRLLDLNDAKGRRGNAPTLGSGYNIGV